MIDGLKDTNKRKNFQFKTFIYRYNAHGELVMLNDMLRYLLCYAFKIFS